MRHLKWTHFALLLSLALSSVQTSHADTPPAPSRKTEALETLESHLQSEKEKKAELAARQKDIKAKLSRTQDDLVELAESVREAEANLSALEARIYKNEKAKAELEKDLKADQGRMSELVTALIRMRRLPPEALVVRPGAPLETAQSALILENVLPNVQKRARRLSEKLQELRRLQETLAADHAEALALTRDLKAKYKGMQALIAQRQQLHNKLVRREKESAERIKRLAGEARSLRELMEKLEKERKREETRAAAQRTVRKIPQKMPRPGQPRLPVQGYITVGYNQTDNIGAESKGLRIRARAGAIVVAPMGGQVMYADHFKKFGRIVIIEHKKGYHSLVAGLAKIDTVVGQNIDAGEPVGVLPNASASGAAPSLYYELRYKGKPVDPARKFADLKS